MYGYGYSLYNRLSFLSGLDPNASAFLTATGITDTTITSAINSLCVDLKKYGVWDKMKAIYPFVGGTATTHKFNLKDARDLDAAFRLSFSGGWTHSSNGALPNGTNGYADTFLTPSVSLSVNNSSLGYYGGNDIGVATNKVAMGSLIGPPYKVFAIQPAYTALGLFGDVNDGSATSTANTNTSGFIFATRTSSTQKTHSIRGVQTIKTETSTGLPTRAVVLGARRFNAIEYYSAIQHRFTFIGDGLTDDDSLNLYYSVQKFQTTLGRQVGTPIYSSNATDVNARLFLGATNIQDVTITSAVDTLVKGLKTDGIWTKLKAVYPFVGGTATTHKFNLANALDEDTAFRLSFGGGWTHSDSGALPNGTNGYANTFVTPSTNLSQNSTHASIYSRTNNTALINRIEIGSSNGTIDFQESIRWDGSLGNLSRLNNAFGVAGYLPTKTSGYFITSRTASSTTKKYEDNVLKETNSATSSSPNAVNITLAGRNTSGVVMFYDAKQYAFATIGDGLTDTEASNLYTRVQAFQTTLNRQV